MSSAWARFTNTDVWKNLARSKAIHFFLLALLGLFTFIPNLNVAFFESAEALYAGIAREMVRTQHFLHLTFLGTPYYNKPPFFFWILALSSTLFGENEVALRLPSALFSLGTVALTYHLGKTLFSRTAGFWAALVVSTTYAFMWYGRVALFDSTLTFFITLSLLAWLHAFEQPASGRWHFLAFLAMALGLMIKALHAFLLPALVVLGLMIVRRDFRLMKARPFWCGFFLFGALVFLYFWALGSQFRQQFFMAEQLNKVLRLSDVTGHVSDSKPIYWYLYMVWPDFIPWSFLIPSSLVLLFSKRPFKQHPRELFVLLWAVGGFLMLSLAPPKHERYLLPIVPGFALMIGYYYHIVFSSSEQKQWATLGFKVMLGLLSIACVVSLFVAPRVLHRRWNVPTSVFPTIFIVIMLTFCSVLVYALVSSKVRFALMTLGILATGFMFLTVHIVVPAIDKGSSAKRMIAEITPFLKRSEDPIPVYRNSVPYHDEETNYYMFFEHSGAHIIAEDQLRETAHKDGQVVILVLNEYLPGLKQIPDFCVRVLREFPRPGGKMFLLSIRSTCNKKGGKSEKGSPAVSEIS